MQVIGKCTWREGGIQTQATLSVTSKLGTEYARMSAAQYEGAQDPPPPHFDADIL